MPYAPGITYNSAGAGFDAAAIAFADAVRQNKKDKEEAQYLDTLAAALAQQARELGIKPDENLTSAAKGFSGGNLGKKRASVLAFQMAIKQKQDEEARKFQERDVAVHEQSLQLQQDEADRRRRESTLAQQQGQEFREAAANIASGIGNAPAQQFPAQQPGVFPSITAPSMTFPTGADPAASRPAGSLNVSPGLFHEPATAINLLKALQEQNRTLDGVPLDVVNAKTAAANARVGMDQVELRRKELESGGKEDEPSVTIGQDPYTGEEKVTVSGKLSAMQKQFGSKLKLPSGGGNAGPAAAGGQPGPKQKTVKVTKDGRTITIPESQLEKAKKLGWK
jgi:hypothetical protein